MRMARIKIHGRSAVYHCISRIVGGERLLGRLEREKLSRMLRRQAAFCGLEVITYCVMINHFHVLLRVPPEQELTDAQLEERVTGYYGPESLYTQALQQQLAQTGRLTEAQRARLLARMGDVSMFNKELKQRFSNWYNRLHERYGTLWSERFKSVLVEDGDQAVRAVAAYIDLNPVRAGLVQDPKDYRWSGYGEAVAGCLLAQKGIASLYETADWEGVGMAYRQLLFVTAGRAGHSGKVVLEPEAIRRELAQGAKLSLAEVLRLRVRYFSDGVVLGSQRYVNEVFAEFRERFGPRRKSGARPLRGLPALSFLTSLRDLRKDAVS